MVITREEVENRIIRKRTPFNMEELIGLDIKGLTYKSITEDKGYPSMEQCLSFKKPLMMIMGAKGMAKSTMVALWVPFFWWNFGEGVVYSRRTEVETHDTDKEWFDNTNEIFEDYDIPFWIQLEGDFYYIYLKEPEEITSQKGYKAPKWVIGRAVSLYACGNRNGAPLTNLGFICYDEFVRSDAKYLGGVNNATYEYEQLMVLYNTLDRGPHQPKKNTSFIIGMGNSFSYNNPLFNAKEVVKYLRPETHFCSPKAEGWMVWQMRQSDNKNAKSFDSSWSYWLCTDKMRGIIFENITAENLNKSDFVKQIKNPGSYYCTIAYDGHFYGVYSNPNEGYLYISKKYKKDTDIYSLTFSDHRPNRLLALSYASIEPIMNIKRFYESGCVFFETSTIKYHIDTYFNYLL